MGMSDKSKEEAIGAEELNTPAAVLKRLEEVTGEERLREWLKNASIQDKSPEFHVSHKPEIRRKHRKVNQVPVKVLTAAHKDYISGLLPYLKLVSTDASAPHPSASFEYEVQWQHCNKLGNLHGGCAATLFDYCTTLVLALINKPGFWFLLGVSRTLNVTYLRPIPAKETVLIECEILQVGKRLTSLKGVIRRRSDGAIMATCEHGKFNTDPPASKF